MTYPSGLLIHSANLQTSETAGTANEYGAVNETPVYTAITCRFGSPRESYTAAKSGDRVIRTPSCIVPLGTNARDGKLLVGLTAPFTKTYRIKSVLPAMLAASISHLVLELEDVE